MNILILSSNPPGYSAGLGADVADSLREARHTVDFITRFEDFDDKNEYTALYPKSKGKQLLNKFLGDRLSVAARKVKSSLRKKLPHPDQGENPGQPEGVIFHNGYEIHYIDESVPGSPTDLILSKSRGSYDLVITLWWFGMINSTSVRELYERFHCPVLIYAIDMAPMTGGCFYFKECRNFRKGCIDCPALPPGESKDLTHRNYEIKLDNYRKSNVAFLGNSWMNDSARQSGLFPDNRLYNVSIIVDETEFSPAGDNPSGAEDHNPTFRMLARSSAEPRKGSRHISESIKSLWQSLDATDRDKLEVVTIGDNTIEESLKDTGIKVTHLGRVDRAGLIEAYRSATCFLSASVDDAGPSMVNQSLMCGTPVVCFNNGTAVDVIIENESGFKSTAIDTAGFCEALKRAHHYLSDPGRLAEIRKSSRAIALKYNSSASFARRISEIYRDMTGS